MIVVYDFHIDSFLIDLHGLPAHKCSGGILPVTTEPAPMKQCIPTIDPGSSTEFIPIQEPLLIKTGLVCLYSEANGVRTGEIVWVIIQQL
jgi:hypothetical protein